MGININSKILLSVASIAAAAALIVGATIAFFSDTETSTGNTFVAGELDLQIDSEAHYAGLVCQGDPLVWVDDNPTSTTRPDLVGQPCVGTWELKDLGESDTFFALSDIKPGDTGENTISLHVFNNDAWGRLVIENVQNLENGCTEPEDDVDGNCGNPGSGEGELQSNIVFSIWLDQGVTPGFQDQDQGQGDNVFQEGDELVLVTSGPLDEGGETLNIWEGLAAAYVANSCAGSGKLDDIATTCPGLGPDGQVIGSFTYYFGLDWELPEDVGNEVQSDSLSADMTFEAEQYRNNPTPFGP